MIDITLQFTGKHYIPYSLEDLEKSQAEYKKNQLTRHKVTKVADSVLPSLEQNNTLHACFKFYADNSDNPMTDTTEKAKLACKCGIAFFVPNLVYVRPDGGVQFVPDSFAFNKLKGKRRDMVMEQAFNWLAEGLGMSVEEMVEVAKSQMRRN